jgi:hypothetical protein
MEATINDLKGRKCPNCGTRGSITLLLTEARFRCDRCGSKNIDPWAIGPWDENKLILDTMEGDRVSCYRTEPLEPSEPAEPNENWLEFLRWQFEGAANRQVVTNKIGEVHEGERTESPPERP